MTCLNLGRSAGSLLQTRLPAFHGCPSLSATGGAFRLRSVCSHSCRLNPQGVPASAEPAMYANVSSDSGRPASRIPLCGCAFRRVPALRGPTSVRANCARDAGSNLMPGVVSSSIALPIRRRGDCDTSARCSPRAGRAASRAMIAPTVSARPGPCAGCAGKANHAPSVSSRCRRHRQQGRPRLGRHCGPRKMLVSRMPFQTASPVGGKKPDQFRITFGVWHSQATPKRQSRPRLLPISRVFHLARSHFVPRVGRAKRVSSFPRRGADRKLPWLRCIRAGTMRGSGFTRPPGRRA